MWSRDPHQLDDDIERVWAGDLQETHGLALCYDADVLQDPIVSRTCACALDRKGVSGLNDLRPMSSWSNSPGVCLQESELLARTWSAGDELPDETLLAGVERLGHDAQELIYTATAAYVTRMRYLCGDRRPHISVLMDQSKVAATECPIRFVAADG